MLDEKISGLATMAAPLAFPAAQFAYAFTSRG